MNKKRNITNSFDRNYSTKRYRVVSNLRYISYNRKKDLKK